MDRIDYIIDNYIYRPIEFSTVVWTLKLRSLWVDQMMALSRSNFMRAPTWSPKLMVGKKTVEN